MDRGPLASEESRKDRRVLTRAHPVRQDLTDLGALQLDNAFWRFSIAVYAQTGVAEECLVLQDAAGADVNLLLFCAWLGSQGLTLSSADINMARATVATWHDGVVRPLRNVRRQVKEVAAGKLEPFRSTVKSVELQSEQIEQAILFAFSKALQICSGPESVAANVQKYIAALSQDVRHSAPRLIEAVRKQGIGAN
jgi:uncharacterized protein (TIGR02444 family)